MATTSCQWMSRQAIPLWRIRSHLKQNATGRPRAPSNRAIQQLRVDRDCRARQPRVWHRCQVQIALNRPMQWLRVPNGPGCRVIQWRAWLRFSRTQALQVQCRRHEAQAGSWRPHKGARSTPVMDWLPQATCPQCHKPATHWLPRVAYLQRLRPAMQCPHRVELHSARLLGETRSMKMGKPARAQDKGQFLQVEQRLVALLVMPCHHRFEVTYCHLRAKAMLHEVLCHLQGKHCFRPPCNPMASCPPLLCLQQACTSQLARDRLPKPQEFLLALHRLDARMWMQVSGGGLPQMHSGLAASRHHGGQAWSAPLVSA
mmetsp:Transcript_93163/g.241178  ORF Transcript_93163/g.241178 Transcript_93163/m.241178 type:complete len:315 (+) Transcript_93163:54-998(+)